MVEYSMGSKGFAYASDDYYHPGGLKHTNIPNDQVLLSSSLICRLAPKQKSEIRQSVFRCVCISKKAAVG